MEKKAFPKDSPNFKSRTTKPKSKNTIKKIDPCESSESSSHTKFLRKPKYEGEYVRISKKEYVGISESMSGSSDTFRCVHGPDEKKYTEKGQLKRNLLKELDPIPTDRKWTEACAPVYGWEIAKTLEFLVTDSVGSQHVERLDTQIRDLIKIADRGYRIDILDSVCTIVDYLVETQRKKPFLRKGLELLLLNMAKPIRLSVMSDAVKYFEKIQNYTGFMGYLLLRLEEDEHFDLVSNSLLWQLTAPDDARGNDAVRRRYMLEAAAPVLDQTTARMLAVTSSHRFPTFLNMALVLACDSAKNCMKLINESIIENIFYRFNPYFPERDLPIYEINPADPQDCNVKLGDSSINMNTTLSLLLVLLKTTMSYVDENPKRPLLLPVPNDYAQRCFIWAYRYECRARDHKHERNTFSTITLMLLHCFGERLTTFSVNLMPDIMSLAVLTEVPVCASWVRTVNINTTQIDVHFKKLLIYLSVEFLNVFPRNNFMLESQRWILGLMYLLDPGLCSLRARWSHSLFAELRKISLQALVATLPLITSNVICEYGIVRRIMWYIEWYSVSPYELQVLYWCVRLLRVAISTRDSPTRPKALQDLFETHGVIIIMHICNVLIKQKVPPVEMSQVIIALCLRILTSAVEADAKVGCCVYPTFRWPASVNSLARTVLDTVLFTLDKHYIISDRWLISLLNFIWVAIIWKSEYRTCFVSNDGIYKLLDLITDAWSLLHHTAQMRWWRCSQPTVGCFQTTHKASDKMSRPAVQCIALAIVCDVARGGGAVGQLVTWRARLAASDTNPRLVKRGATIASLMAAIFRDDCHTSHVPLDENDIIQNLDSPLLSKDMREELNKPDFRVGASKRTPLCLAAADMAGSRKSKVFALLHMLSEDLSLKVSLADEAFNLYKNIKLNPKDEAILVLCSHYLTIKQNETWMETKIQSPGYLEQDEEILEEFLHIGKGWAKEIKLQQERVIELAKKKEMDEECSLYAFLARVRLNIALDALREARCIARSADRAQMSHALIHDAVVAHHRRSVAARAQGEPVLRTYAPPLDDQNVTGQYVKVFSIHPKNKPKPRDVVLSA